MKRILFFCLIGLVVINSSCKKNGVAKSPAQTLTANKSLFATGNQFFKWAKIVPSLTDILDMQIDGDGNIYYLNQGSNNVGTPEFPNTVYYSTILKLDTAGSLVWQKTLPEIVYKMVLDVKGNVYCYGTELADDYNTSFKYSEVLHKFDTDTGTESLTKVVASGVSGFGKTATDIDDIGVDGNGNIFFVGAYLNGADIDPGPGVCLTTGNGAFYLKLNADGSTAFVTPNTLKTGLKSAKLCVGLDGSVAFAGLAEINGTTHVEAEAYKSNGVFAWSKSIDLLKPNAGGLKFMNYNGKDFYLGVGYIFNISVAYQYTIYKIDKGGNLIYQANIASGIPRNSMAVDPNGNVYFTGYFTKGSNNLSPDFDPRASEYRLVPPLGSDMYIDQYDAGGNFRGAVCFHSTTSAYQNDVGKSIIADKKGNLYFSGIFDNPIDFDPTLGVNILTPANIGTQQVFLVKLSQFNP